MIDLGQILTAVVERTSTGKLQWSRTVNNDRFVTSVDAISIVIVETDIHNEEGEFMREVYRLDITNESGDTIESLRYGDTTLEQDQQLARLYVLARRSALDVDSTLEKLAKALEL